MKKVISFLLSLVLIITCFSSFTASASVTITIQIGDVNASGSINNKDLGLLMQYLNDWDVVGFHLAAADTNGDGSVNNKDYGLLMQYINDWDVTLGVGNANTSISGKTIKFISTIDPAVDESGPVVENFEKKYNVMVEIIPSGLDEHAMKCMGLIAAGVSPDVARSNGDFPLCLGYLQSLDAAKIDYNDQIWDQDMFRLTTFNGSPYLCNTYGNIWAENDIVVYSKSLLKRANAYTPEEYDAMGKWTWDAFFEIAKACQKIGDHYAAINSYETFYHACGGSIYNLQDGEFKNGIDYRTTEIMTKYSQARKDGIIMNWKSTSAAIIDGSASIATMHAWSLKKTGDLRTAKWDDLGFYYLPYYDEEAAATKVRPSTGYFRGWGICKGAQEPVAAGVFLREYLDVNNYDSGGTFITPEAETFFYRVTEKDYSVYNPYFTYIDLNVHITGVKSAKDIYYPMFDDPEQVIPSMPSVRANVDKGVKNLNDFIKQYINVK